MKPSLHSSELDAIGGCGGKLRRKARECLLVLFGFEFDKRAQGSGASFLNFSQWVLLHGALSRTLFQLAGYLALVFTSLEEAFGDCSKYLRNKMNQCGSTLSGRISDEYVR